MSIIKSEKSKLHRCFYRPKGVHCDKGQEYCTGCGWNPEIEDKRKAKLNRKGKSSAN